MRTGMHWKFVAASASLVLIASGCATQDQLRKTEAQTAEALGVTDRTVQRDWAKARLLLRRTLESSADP